MARVPFAPLDNPRLQHLASAKNRQNGFTAQKSPLGGKASFIPTKTAFSSNKRPLEVPAFDDYDSENVDPARSTSPSKKTKGKRDAFALCTDSEPAPPITSSRITTPVRASIPSVRTPMTAPAGRSPPRKIAGMSKNRRTSAPFTRIDPPFATRGASLPFSLDAALSGTFGASAAKPTPASTIQESMPKTWFFEIYEDTPEEEAANLMEHSTLTLDLSSDDEGSKRVKDDRGKENCPPEGYEAGVASRALDSVAVVSVGAPTHVRTEIIRKKIFTDEMDDGERSPLSDLETEVFIPEGLNRNSHVVVDLPTPEKTASAVAVKSDADVLFAAPTVTIMGPPTTAASPSLIGLPVVSAASDAKGEIVVWEDSSSPTPETAIAPVNQNDAGKEKTIEVCDENTAPLLDA
ncbi:hypothetical protein LTR29_012433 [Friedmanniomyces endolithicus]|uniref:Uncharacterized protein n=1 Tax=Friedmanniomyces endolithicus TaxID=329885 RepID=A0A4U0VCA1_9PEZI|nr:hypothetical protein LTS09_000748 [Friedmanniomyces endolithicus]KAK0935973.1 hypothetical protein LTR29_012433 [Friedmanniomyces endolithicus]TKA46600.1 hypothetical protein B0A54_02432 [Friedmanniomyces endolithicus]